MYLELSQAYHLGAGHGTYAVACGITTLCVVQCMHSAVACGFFSHTVQLEHVVQQHLLVYAVVQLLGHGAY